MKKLIYITFILFISISCSTVQISPKPTSALNSELARVSIKRVSAFFGFARKFEVFDNGKKIGELGNGGELIWDRDYGEMVLSIPRPSGYGGSSPASFRDVIVITKAGYKYTLLVNEIGVIK